MDEFEKWLELQISGVMSEFEAAIKSVGLRYLHSNDGNVDTSEAEVAEAKMRILTSVKEQYLKGKSR